LPLAVHRREIEAALSGKKHDQIRRDSGAKAALGLYPGIGAARTQPRLQGFHPGGKGDIAAGRLGHGAVLSG
jgi:hypothetical protein